MRSRVRILKLNSDRKRGEDLVPNSVTNHIVVYDGEEELRYYGVVSVSTEQFTPNENLFVKLKRT